MLNYNDLKLGTLFVLDGEPYQVLEYEFLRMQQRKPVAKTKIKNMLTGKVVERNFHQNESFKEAEIVKRQVIYLYSHRGEYWFREKDDPAKRFALNEAVIGEPNRFLKGNIEVTAAVFEEKIVNISLPIKVDLKIQETPPGEKGNTAQGGSKTAILETGAKISVPLFVNQDDIVRVNTETGEYIERVKKGNG